MLKKCYLLLFFSLINCSLIYSSEESVGVVKKSNPKKYFSNSYGPICRHYLECEFRSGSIDELAFKEEVLFFDFEKGLITEKDLYLKQLLMRYENRRITKDEFNRKMGVPVVCLTHPELMYIGCNLFS